MHKPGQAARGPNSLHCSNACRFSPLQDTIFQYTSRADVLKVELEEAEWLYGVPAAEALEDPERVRTVSGCSAAQACRVTAVRLCSRGGGGAGAVVLDVPSSAMSRRPQPGGTRCTDAAAEQCLPPRGPGGPLRGQLESVASSRLHREGHV